VLEFLARVLDHLPEPRQQLVRYWGWYSNVTRGGRRRRQEEGGTTPTACPEPGDEAKSRRLSWSQLIRKVYEIDPLLCTFAVPRCAQSLSPPDRGTPPPDTTGRPRQRCALRALPSGTLGTLTRKT